MQSADPDVGPAAVEALRGAFADGYTSEDVDAALGVMTAWTGLDLVVGWQRREGMFLGDSDVYLRDGHTLRAAPDDVHEFLFLGDDSIRVDGLRGRDAGPAPVIALAREGLGRNVLLAPPQGGA